MKFHIKQMPKTTRPISSDITQIIILMANRSIMPILKTL